MNKIIAFDLDGTLAESKQPITMGMAEMVYTLALRARVIIISGGSFAQFEAQVIPHIVHAAEKRGNKTGLENVILMPTNGSKRFEYDIDLNAWKETHMFPFDEAVKRKVMLKLNEIAAGNFDVPRKHYGDYAEDRITQITFSGLGQLAPLEEKKSWDPHMEKRNKIKHELESSIPEIEANIGGMTSIDILPKNFNKATGLLGYISEEKLNVHNMIFIGDAVFPGGNDYPPEQAGIETIKTTGPSDTMRIIQSL